MPADGGFPGRMVHCNTVSIRCSGIVKYDNLFSTVSRGKDIALRVRNRIRELRKANGVTQERLAELSGVDYKHIQLLEGARPPAVRIDTLEKIALGFGLTLAEFFSTPAFSGRKGRRKA